MKNAHNRNIFSPSSLRTTNNNTLNTRGGGGNNIGASDRLAVNFEDMVRNAEINDDNIAAAAVNGASLNCSYNAEDSFDSLSDRSFFSTPMIVPVNAARGIATSQAKHLEKLRKQALRRTQSTKTPEALLDSPAFVSDLKFVMYDVLRLNTAETKTTVNFEVKCANKVSYLVHVTHPLIDCLSTSPSSLRKSLQCDSDGSPSKVQ